jgi:flagellar motor switch protein FliG
MELTTTERPVAPSNAGLEKAAILLLTLGTEAARDILGHLAHGEIQALSQAMARVRSIPHAAAAAVHEEARRWLSPQESRHVDGESFVRRVIATATAPASGHATPAASDPVATHSSTSIAARLDGVPAEVIAKVLADEHPQVAALVIANLATRQAADVVVRMPDEQQSDVVQRVAELRTVPEEVLTDVGNAIVGQVERLGAAGRAGVPTGGAKLAADILNLVGHFTEERILSAMDARSQETAETIRNLMLTFEDLQRLDNRGMQTLLKDVGRDDLLLSLKTASPLMQERILTNLSLRAREIMQEDLATLGPVRVKDVERAQASIVLAARRLAEEQKIQLGISADDAII